MNPENLSDAELMEMIRQEARQVVLHEARTARAISPVEVKAPWRFEGPSEELVWFVIGGITAIIAVPCFLWMLP